jgi:hypothetical protein
MKDKMTSIAVFLAVAVLAGCGDGSIPTMKSYVEDDEVDKIRLPEYSPPTTGDESYNWERYSVYGTMGTRINPDDLYIKNTYRTSDDVIHIILSGKISNGIPEGLLWNEDADADFGAPSGVYMGRGDFRIGVLGPETGGSAAIGSPDFSAEWVMAGPYTAIVLEGLVDAGNRTSVIEKNESLNLLSSEYRSKSYPESELYTSLGGKLQKSSKYTYNPNNFRPWPEPALGQSYWNNSGDPRGGYVMLISKSEKAVPYIASFDIEYSNGAKKRFEVDYSDVQLREEIPLTGISFQNPTPVGNYVLMDNSNPDETEYFQDIQYVVDSPLEIEDIILQSDNKINKPLLLRPLYEPADPRKATTNMISSIYLTDTISGVPVNNDNLVLTWDDKTQAITLYVKDGAMPVPEFVTINASLRLSNAVVRKLTCDVTINPPSF